MSFSWYEKVAKMNLSKEEYRVLMMLITLIGIEQGTKINQAGMARELGMERQNINRAIKGLIERGVLSRKLKQNRVTRYELNDLFFNYDDFE